MSETEHELLVRYAADSDAEAFRALVERHRDMVFATCRRILGEAAEAEDAAQECFLRLVRKAGQLKAPIGAWLHRVAVQLSIDMLRNRTARRARERCAAVRPDRAEATWEDISQAVDEAIEALPERLRAPIVLYYLEDRKQEEVASELGVTDSAVSKRLRRGVEALRRHLRKAGRAGSAAVLSSLLVSNAVEAAPATLTVSLGKMALAGAGAAARAAGGVGVATATAAAVGGVTAMKATIVVLAGAVLLLGGVAVHEAMSGQKATPTGAAPQAPPHEEPKAKNEAPATETPDWYDYTPIMAYSDPEQKGNRRHPTLDEVLALGAAWPRAPWHLNAVYYYACAGYWTLKVSEVHPPPPGSLCVEAPYAGDLIKFRAWVEANRTWLQVIQEGVPLRVCKVPVFGLTLRGHETMVPDVGILAGLRNLARTCCDAAFAEELEGRYDQAAEWYLRVVRMGRQLSTDGMMIQYLVGVAIGQLGVDGVNRLMANQRLSDDALRGIIAECRAAESLLQVITNVWKCEAAFQNFTSKAVLDYSRQQEAIGKMLEAPLWKLVSRRDGLQAMLDREAWSGVVTAVYVKSLLPPLSSWLVRLGQADASLRATEVRAALILYEREKKTLPDTLADLVPGFLPAVPSDPFVRGPLKYEKTAGGWRLWSVGDDQADNGGIVGNPAIPWGGPDYVFVSKVKSNEDHRRRLGGQDWEAPRESPEQVYEREMEKLRGAAWKKQDAVETNLTWYADKGTLAVADANRKQVKWFDRLLGYDAISISGIAFGKDTVWLGTDKGLMAYDRKGGFWNRFAVGGTMLEAPVAEPSITEGGKLRVTAGEKGKERRFEYEPGTKKWSALPG